MNSWMTTAQLRQLLIETYQQGQSSQVCSTAQFVKEIEQQLKQFMEQANK